MRYFFFKLLAPRADFVQTMTDAERSIMGQHAAYMAGFADKGWAVAYGPVMSEQGAFGAAFMALPDDEDPKPLADNDPAIKSGLGFRYEVSPMPSLVIGRAVDLG